MVTTGFQVWFKPLFLKPEKVSGFVSILPHSSKIEEGFKFGLKPSFKNRKRFEVWFKSPLKLETPKGFGFGSNPPLRLKPERVSGLVQTSPFETPKGFGFGLNPPVCNPKP